MKKYLVIGNPVEHSLSPKLHNYWIKENKIDAVYEKRQLNETDIQKTVLEVKNGKIDGINVTVPFKKAVIPFEERLEVVSACKYVDLAIPQKSINKVEAIIKLRLAIKHMVNNLSKE